MPRLWYAPGCLLSSSIRMPLNLMCREREEDLSLSAATCLTAPRFGTCTVLHMHSVLCCACMCTVHAQWQLHVACACTTEVGRAARRASAPSGRPRRAAPMGKHSKNSNDRAFFSYHERKAASYGRLSSAMLGGHNTADGNHQSHGWGTMQRTLDGDAMKEIDACSLSLQACVHPVVTENGILYDKQVIVEYILSRKKVMARPPQPRWRQPLSPAPWSSAALARQVMRTNPPRRMTPHLACHTRSSSGSCTRGRRRRRGRQPTPQARSRRRNRYG
jgi:hypothetical protein